MNQYADNNVLYSRLQAIDSDPRMQTTSVRISHFCSAASSISPRPDRPKAAPSAEGSSTIFAMLDSWGNIRRCRLLIWRHRLSVVLTTTCTISSSNLPVTAMTEQRTQGLRQLVCFNGYPSTFLCSIAAPYHG